LTLTKGRVRFEVQKNRDRIFEVRAGDVKVSVIGTIFTVGKSGGQVSVSVERGRVRVDAPGRTVFLNAAESASFDEASKATDPGVHVQSVPAKTPSSPGQTVVAMRLPENGRSRSADSTNRETVSPAPVRAADAPKVTWQSLADAKRYDEAYALIASIGPSDLSGDPDELLYSADVARLASHHEKAIQLLAKALHDYQSDPRASMAAFALGKILLEEAGRPGEAAKAFRKAYEINPGGPLAEDARAREVEALFIEGNQQLAGSLAEEYIRLYPAGSRVASVKRFGGIK
jgi:transmembrane sensor